MYAAERRVVLAQRLAAQGRVSVVEAADELGVSGETVRRDLAALERSGVARRVHGGAVARSTVQAVELRLSEREEKAIVDILTSTWGLPIIEARLVVEISVAPELRDLDRVGLCRGFYEFTNHEDRLAFVRCLFQIANACGKTSNDEIEKVQLVKPW